VSSTTDSSGLNEHRMLARFLLFISHGGASMCMIDSREMCRAILEDADLLKAFELDSEGGLDFLEALLVAPDARDRTLADSVLTQLRGIEIREQVKAPPPRTVAAPMQVIGGFQPALAAI
jgi:hypothetical protein